MMSDMVSEMEPVGLLAIRDSALSVDEVLASVHDPGAGGVVVFVGTVRDEDARRAVLRLAYSAHPSALAELRRVAEKIVADYPVRRLAAVHRVGSLEIGDLAVVVAVSCPHRAEAFAACRLFIDELKATVPIWKHQQFADGSADWIGAV